MIVYCERCGKYRVMHAKWDYKQIVVYCPMCQIELRRYSEEKSKERTIQSLIKLDIHRELLEKQREDK